MRCHCIFEAFIGKHLETTPLNTFLKFSLHCNLFIKPCLHIVLMVVSTVANTFLTLFQAVLIHVNTLITTSQA